MGFCRFSSETVISNSTAVDNIFIDSYLPYANDTCVKVYLYGLYKCNTPDLYDNTLASFSSVLGISEEDIYTAFLYWQEQGLVQILATEPFEVVYMPLKNAISNTKKYNKDKYADFNLQLESIFKGRIITLNEYYQYYDFIETYHMEPEALILIIEYSARAKGYNVGYSYVLTIARNWASEGILTYEQVENKLMELEQNSSEIGELFGVLGIKRVATIDEKDYLRKWKNDFEFTFETIIGVCKLCKKKKRITTNFEKLDNIFKNYYEMKLSSIKEIESYEAEKDELYKTSKKVCRNLGLYYDNLEPVSSNYTQKWVTMGFDDATLGDIANYCFKSSIKSLDGMDNIVSKFFKLGITTTMALAEYLSEVLKNDEEIKSILDELGLVRNVNKFDRDFYKIWKNDWNINDSLIKEAISLSRDKASPMQYLNKILSYWHTNGVETVESSKNFQLADQTNTKAKPKQNYKEQRDYTKTDLNALFDNLEEVEL
ncbi:MAG: DnaD domain protein [Clostridia bacterium]|nr:DnaD domain protein [Clostridia bacterium]